MKNVLVAGSIAFDHLMTFDGAIKDSLYKDADFENISLSLLANSHEKHFGGCGANIAYSLSLLDIKPYLVGVVGNDFRKYGNWLEDCDVDLKYVEIDENAVTASAYIISDNDQNQFTIFSPSAMSNLDKCMNFGKHDWSNIDYAIVSPAMPQRMTALAANLASRDISYIFDPGQSIPVLSKKQLLEILDNADGVVLNEYETGLLSQKLGMSLEKIVTKLNFLITTLGGKGCDYYHDGNKYHVDAVSDLDVVDCTGCGDSFRSGFLCGLINGLPIKRASEMGCVCASFLIETEGTQMHKFSAEQFSERLERCY